MTFLLILLSPILAFLVVFIGAWLFIGAGALLTILRKGIRKCELYIKKNL